MHAVLHHVWEGEESAFFGDYASKLLDGRAFVLKAVDGLYRSEILLLVD